MHRINHRGIDDSCIYYQAKAHENLNQLAANRFCNIDNRLEILYTTLSINKVAKMKIFLSLIYILSFLSNSVVSFSSTTPLKKHCPDLAEEVFNWDTNHVGTYYSNAPADFLEKLAVEKGLSNNKDLFSLKPFIKLHFNSDGENLRVVEVGSGTGRVLSWFRSNFKNCILTGYEGAKISADRLTQKFKNDTDVLIKSESFLNAELTVKADLIIWPWSVFLELNPREKSSSIDIIRKTLVPNGMLVIDLPLEIKGSDGEKIADQDDFVKIDDGFGVFYAHLISTQSLIELVKSAGLTFERKVIYTTDPYSDANNQAHSHRGLKRQLIIFRQIFR